MPLDAGTVIDLARGLDPSFTPNRHPDRVCYEFLSRFQRRLAAKMLQRESESISVEISFALPLATFANGIPLESAPAVPLQIDREHGFHLVAANGDDVPLIVVPFKQRLDNDHWPFAYLRAGTLILLGRESEWSGYTAVVFTYAPTPGLVVAADDELVLPDSALDVTVLSLGANLAMRIPEKVSRKTLPAEARDSEIDYLDMIEERNDVETGKVRRVFS